MNDRDSRPEAGDRNAGDMPYDRTTISGVDTRVSTGDVARALSLPETRRIGPYRIVRKLGEGGIDELSDGALGGGGFSSTVIRYGIGGSYDVNPGHPVVVTPVVELVGWSAIDGYATRSADGTLSTVIFESGERDIVNLRLGARLSWDRYPGSVYVGWGTTLTSAWWYENIVRVEYRYTFF